MDKSSSRSSEHARRVNATLAYNLIREGKLVGQWKPGSQKVGRGSPVALWQ